MRIPKCTLLLALFAALLAGPALAQDDAPPPDTEKVAPTKPAEKPKGAEMDDLSKATLKAYEKKAYHLGRAGVEKASCKIAVTVSSMMAGEMKGNADYVFDGEKGTLTWDNSQLGMMLAQQGLGAKQLDQDFDEEGFKKALAGTKLTAEKAEDGAVTITVKGETEAGFKTMRFGADGILSEFVVSQDTGMGQKQDITVKLTHEEKEGALLVTKEFVSLETPMGPFEMTSTTTWAKSGGYWVKEKIEAVSKMGGQTAGNRTVEYSEWKFNDDVGKKEE